MAGTFRQEMPRSGGYGPINWAKKLRPIQRIKGWHMLVLGSAAYLAGRFYWIYRARTTLELKLEAQEARVALTPFMVAERNRLYLKQIRKNRDEEEELMGDIDGWEVGTLWGEPVYHYNYHSDWTDPSLNEYFVHAHPEKALFKQRMTRHFTSMDNMLQDPS